MAIARTPPHELRQLAAQEQACREETVAQFAAIEAAALVPGPSGALRRAMLKRLPSEVAARSGIEVDRLVQFRCGDGLLTSDEFDRLAVELNLVLTPTSEAD